jgi:hypothetical protein
VFSIFVATVHTVGRLFHPQPEEASCNGEQAQGPSWYVPAFCVTAKVMFCVDVEVGLYVNGRTEAEVSRVGCCGGRLASEGESNRRLENIT